MVDESTSYILIDPQNIGFITLKDTLNYYIYILLERFRDACHLVIVVDSYIYVDVDEIFNGSKEVHMLDTQSSSY